MTRGTCNTDAPRKLAGTNQPSPSLEQDSRGDRISRANEAAPPDKYVPTAGPSFRRALRQPIFLRLWLAQLVSQSGDFILEVALLWLVLQATGSVLDVGIVVTGTYLPAVVLGPFLGVYIDRWSRKKVLVVTNLVEGAFTVLLAGLVMSGMDSLAPIFGVVLVLGAGAQMVSVATSAYVPSLVRRDDLAPANSLLSLSGSFNQIVGLSLGGVLVALVGVTFPIEYDAVTFFAAAILLASVYGTPGLESPPPARAPSFFATEFREGLSFIRENRFMLEIIVVGMLANFFLGGIESLIPSYTSDVLRGGATLYGFLVAAVAAGSLMGSFPLGSINTRRSSGKLLLMGGVGLGLCLMAVGLVINILPAMALMLMAGIAVAMMTIPMQTLSQAKTPDQLRGRVGGTRRALVTAAAPVGPIFLGWLAVQRSVPQAFVVSGLAILIVMLAGLVVMRDLWSIEY